MSQTSPASRHPPKPRLTVRVGITGHRPNKLDDEAAARVARQLPLIFSAIEDAAAKILRDNAALFAEEPLAFRLVCGFAEGADQMAVAACPSGWQIEAVLPFPHDEYLKDFSQSANGDGRDVSAAFVESLKKATTVTQLPAPRPDDRAKSYADAGGYLLRQIDVLIAVWDGEPPQPGGTGAIAREAFDGHIPVVWLMTTEDLPPRLITGFDDDEQSGRARRRLHRRTALERADAGLRRAVAGRAAATRADRRAIAWSDFSASAGAAISIFRPTIFSGGSRNGSWPRPVIHAPSYEARVPRVGRVRRRDAGGREPAPAAARGPAAAVHLGRHAGGSLLASLSQRLCLGLSALGGRGLHCARRPVRERRRSAARQGRARRARACSSLASSSR